MMSENNTAKHNEDSAFQRYIDALADLMISFDLLCAALPPDCFAEIQDLFLRLKYEKAPNTTEFVLNVEQCMKDVADICWRYVNNESEPKDGVEKAEYPDCI